MELRRLLLCAAGILVACAVEAPSRDAGGDGAIVDRGPIDGGFEDAAVEDRVALPSSPTWHEHIRPIVVSRCASCHRAGHVGPFSLERWEEVRARARPVLAAIEARTMPPWMPMQGCGTFQHDRSLRDDEIELVRRWVAAGAPEGDASRATMMPSPVEVPFRVDLRLPMIAPYVPDFSASTTMADDYRCFVLARSMPRTVWVTGYDVEPGVRAMVHHANVYAVPAASAASLDAGPRGYSCFGGAGLSDSRTVGVWVPGTPPAKYPANTGIQINAGEALVVQMHYYRYTSGGAPPADQSAALFELSPVPPPRLAQLTGPGANGFVIPARTMGHVIRGTWTVPSRGTLWGVLPHMHKIGRRVSVRIGDACAIEIPRWDFHWQQAYFYAQNGGIPVAAGAVTSIACEYDNRTSSDVRNGEGSDEEMCGAPFYYTPE